MTKKLINFLYLRFLNFFLGFPLHIFIRPLQTFRYERNLKQALKLFIYLILSYFIFLCLFKLIISPFLLPLMIDFIPTAMASSNGVDKTHDLSGSKTPLNQHTRTTSSGGISLNTPVGNIEYKSTSLTTSGIDYDAVRATVQEATKNDPNRNYTGTAGIVHPDGSQQLFTFTSTPNTSSVFKGIVQHEPHSPGSDLDEGVTNFTKL